MKATEKYLQYHLRTEIRDYQDYEFKEKAPWIICEDGTELSVQASSTHYCQPRNNRGPYGLVEVGYPSKAPGQSWDAYDDGNGDVYGYVPIDMVVGYINDHGGIKELKL